MCHCQDLAEKVQDSLAEANNVAEEACSTMRTVRSFANEGGEVARYAGKLAETLRLYKRQAFMYSGYTICSMVRVHFIVKTCSDMHCISAYFGSSFYLVRSFRLFQRYF